MNHSKPINQNPVIKPVSKAGDDAQEQDADVSSDRSAPGGPSKKAPLPINEIEDMENDAEGG